MEPSTPRRQIEELRNYLAAQVQFPEDTPTWGAAALTRYLSGEAPTLDHAFGLVAPAHRGIEDDRRWPLALQAWQMRAAGATVAKIVAAFEAEGKGVRDERWMRRLMAEFRPRWIAQEVNRRLESAAPGEKYEDISPSQDEPAS